MQIGQSIVGIVFLLILIFGVVSASIMSLPISPVTDTGTHGIDVTSDNKIVANPMYEIKTALNGVIEKKGGKRMKYMDPSYGIVGFIFAFSLFAWDYLTNL